MKVNNGARMSRMFQGGHWWVIISFSIRQFDSSMIVHAQCLGMASLFRASWVSILYSHGDTPTRKAMIIFSREIAHDQQHDWHAHTVFWLVFSYCILLFDANLFIFSFSWLLQAKASESNYRMAEFGCTGGASINCDTPKPSQNDHSNHGGVSPFATQK